MSRSAASVGRRAAPDRRRRRWPSAWARVRAPGMTVVTPGWSRTQRSATCAPWPRRRAPAPRELAHGVEADVVGHAGERLADVERLAVPVVGAVVVGRERRVASYRPDSSPQASGTRAMIADAGRRGRGSTASSGLRRNALRMICTLATPGRAIAAQRLAQRLHADAVRRDRALVDQGVEVVVTSRRARTAPSAGSAAGPGRGCRRRGWPATGRSRPGRSSRRVVLGDAAGRPGGPSWWPP